ncbi:MAG: chromosomal replication initiator protein DnaA [Desulfobulbaceae bacterium]|nr:chromosomal replication initiator protein DnaA [Desulfobulbaceae bacterium]
MLWQKIKSKMQERLPSGTYSLWIEPLKCVRADDTYLDLVGPDRFFCSWVSENYQPLMDEILKSLQREGVEIRFSSSAPVDDSSVPALPDNRGRQLKLPSMRQCNTTIRTLHPRYTFDEFVVGESNILAQSACEAIANGDIALGRCLYIGAGTGLGKSHLSHAVAHHLLENSPNVRLHYLTAQQLTTEMVKALKEKTMEQFKEKYHNQCDVLLLEDVHSLAGRVKTQEELAAAVDVLMETGKRIIYTGAVKPRQIPDIGEGFRSRLSAGLITTINPPDAETRHLIIRRKAKNKGLLLSDELVEFMSENVKGDIRKIESAIVGLKAKACLLKVAPDLDMVKEVISDILGQSSVLTVDLIRDFLASQFRVSVHDLRSKSRKKSIAFPRQLSMYFARKLTEQPLSEIGRAFNRDHSTVVHSIRVITEMVARNGSVRGQVEHLDKKLAQKFL